MRTPKPYYFKHGVVVFFVKDKQIHYKVIKWSEDGFFSWVYGIGKYDGNIERIIAIN